ncbi:MAG TPA: hypothetical protein VLT33_42130, partial [Labilithrix sp.]|nr:hypothetical protein [Labilithrix sp.]
MRKLLVSGVALAVLIGGSWLAACSPPDGDGDGDGGTDTGADASTDDAGLDAATDAGDDAGMDAGDDADAGTDAGDDADAGTDAGDDAGSDAGACTALYCGPAKDFAVDSTNLYVLIPASTTIAKCPLVGCAASGPSPLVVNSNAVQIQAVDSFPPGMPPTVYYGAIAFGPFAAKIMGVSSEGG